MPGATGAVPVQRQEITVETFGTDLVNYHLDSAVEHCRRLALAAGASPSAPVDFEAVAPTIVSDGEMPRGQQETILFAIHSKLAEKRLVKGPDTSERVMTDFGSSLQDFRMDEALAYCRREAAAFMLRNSSPPDFTGIAPTLKLEGELSREDQTTLYEKLAAQLRADGLVKVNSSEPT